MADSGEEIRALQKRLKAAEEAIRGLKAKDLEIAKTLGASICVVVYNMGLLFQKGEQYEAYVGFWKKKVDATVQRIKGSRRVGSILELVDKFYAEHADYIKAQKVKTAAEATEIAHSFIKKYSTVALPMKAVREKDVWVVDIDVGALAVKIAKVKVDARTGDILSHEIPEK